MLSNHSFIPRELPKFVKLGGQDLLNNVSTLFSGIYMEIERVVVHKEYDPNLAYHDIALVKLKSKSL